MVNDNLLQLAKIPYTNNTTPTENLDYETRLRLLYHRRSKNDHYSMSSKGAEAISSMGNDTP
jgi:glutamate synthase (ferredoxin)